MTIRIGIGCRYTIIFELKIHSFHGPTHISLLKLNSYFICLSKKILIFNFSGSLIIQGSLAKVTSKLFCPSTSAIPSFDLSNIKNNVDKLWLSCWEGFLLFFYLEHRYYAIHFSFSIVS